MAHKTLRKVNTLNWGIVHLPLHRDGMTGGGVAAKNENEGEEKGEQDVRFTHIDNGDRSTAISDGEHGEDGHCTEASETEVVVRLERRLDWSHR